MKVLTIEVNGKEYPCRLTMGAMLRFRRETGRDVTEMTGSIEDLCTYLWCCVCSASRRDGKDFDMSLMDFADALDPGTLTAWANGLGESAPAAEDSEKKT